MDLLDLYRGRLSWRRLRVIIRHLPADSALARELHGESADWSRTDRLLADLVDIGRLHMHTTVAVNLGKDQRHPWPAPQPVPRPWMAEPAPPPAARRASPAEIADTVAQAMDRPPRPYQPGG
ncbi:hypothetical protein [Frankia sp. Cr1]|uniref:hypothetical protein n=1 Tax=Frankia sp. Cr1 TaxID=3073931 RepID=UPI002AD3A781|nr:hypothetical protein [Frankia sp. Cr1]